MLPGGRGGWGGIVREFGIDMYTLLYLKSIGNKYLLYSTGNSILCNNLNGKRIRKRKKKQLYFTLDFTKCLNSWAQTYSPHSKANKQNPSNTNLGKLTFALTCHSSQNLKKLWKQMSLGCEYEVCSSAFANICSSRNYHRSHLCLLWKENTNMQKGENKNHPNTAPSPQKITDKCIDTATMENSTEVP